MIYSRSIVTVHPSIPTGIPILGSCNKLYLKFTCSTGFRTSPEILNQNYVIAL